MSRAQVTRDRSAWLALAASALVWLVAAGWGIGSYPLVQPDEGRNATVALEVSQLDRWLIPTFDGVDYLDKPLLWFDLAALALRLPLAPELAVRLPSVVATALTILLVTWFARRLYGAVAARVGAVALATSPLVLGFARVAIFDALLTFFVVLALVLLYEAIEAEGGADIAGGARSSGGWALLAWGAMALGTLTKGPVAVAIPLVVALPYALWRRRARTLWSWAGLLGFLAAVGGWVASVELREPGYVWYVAEVEIWTRITSPELGPRGPVWYFLPVLIWGSLPWLVVAAWAWVGRGSWPAAAGPRAVWRRTTVYLVLWLVMPTLLVSLAQPQRIQYVLPVMPAISLLLAAAVAHRGLAPGALRAGAALLALFGAAFLAVGTGLVSGLERLPARLADPASRTALLLGLVFLVPPVAAAALARRRPPIAVLALCLPCLSMPIVLFPMLNEVAEMRSSRGLAREIDAAYPGAPVVGLETLPTSLPFYLRRPIRVVSATGTAFESHYVQKNWERIVATEPTMTRALDEELPARAVVVLDLEDQQRFPVEPLTGFTPLASDAHSVVLGRGCAAAGPARSGVGPVP